MKAVDPRFNKFFKYGKAALSIEESVKSPCYFISVFHV